MAARSESSSLRADGLTVAAIAAVGVVLFVATWAILHGAHYDDVVITDVGVYQDYGERMADGQVPYRDFALEYPPGALPVFLLPALGSPGDYETLFQGLMLLCGCAAVALVAIALSRAGASTLETAAGVVLTALAPLLLGQVILTRFDLWPAALVTGALAALCAGRPRLGLGVLGAAVAAKLYALVLLPLAVLFVWRQRGRREALVALGVFAAVLVVVVGPFLALAPGGLADSVTRQTGRPLQIESLGAAVLLAADRMHVYDATVETSHGSQNLVGELPDDLANAETVLLVAAVGFVWFLFARSTRSPDRLLAASAACVVAFVAFGKVLSPQFLIWLIPLVPLVRGRAGVGPALVFAAALLATQLWFPRRYWDVVAVGPQVWFVLARDLLLVALLLVLLPLTGRAREPRGSP
jgi:hypothetical protein